MQVRAALHARTVEEALEHLVDDVVAEYPAYTAVLRAGTGASRAASEAGYSRRQWFRLRAHALGVLERRIRALVDGALPRDPRHALYVHLADRGRSAFALEIIRLKVRAGEPVSREEIMRCSGPDRIAALLEFARAADATGDTARYRSLMRTVRQEVATLGSALDPIIACLWYEIERYDVRRRGDARAGRRIALQERALAPDGSAAAVRAMLAEAEAACVLGELDGAYRLLWQCEQRIEPNHGDDTLLLLAWVQAYVAYVSGDVDAAAEAAERCAVLAAPIHRGLSLRAQALALRAKVRAQRRDALDGTTLIESGDGGWYAADAAAAVARVRLAEGDAAGAARVAAKAARIARNHGAPAVAAFAEAVLARADRMLGHVRRGERYAHRARETLDRLGHVVYSMDL